MRSKKRSQQKKRSRRKIKNKIMDGTVEKDHFMVVSLKGCPFCESAKQLITKNSKSITNLEINKNDKDFWNKFVQTQFKKNHDTFPKIFRKGKFIGGFSELQQII
jgi:glutaredoxin 3